MDEHALRAVATLLRRATRAEILPRFRRLTHGMVRTKSGPLDLVTDADEAAERFIAAGLRDLFPGCAVVGEEGTAADAALPDQLAGSALSFVVDPVDGTANFAAGLPLFGCMAAAFRHGEAVAAWIHDPLGDDTAVALRGGGAWMAGPDGERLGDLRVSGPAPVSRSVGTVSWTYMPEPLRSRVLSRLPLLGGALSFRCAAHDYRMLAGGHSHFALYNRLMPWDHAPGWLLHAEAGGYAARFDGSAFDPARHRDGGLLCAADEASWAALREAILEE